MGKLSQQICDEEDGETVDLPKNYRSTPRIIGIANEWSQTIQDRAGMTNPAMSHGLATRTDTAAEHVALLRFPQRQDEAFWIAETIAAMVDPVNKRGAFQDDTEGPARSLPFRHRNSCQIQHGRSLLSGRPARA